MTIGKLYQFIDRTYNDFFYLVVDSGHGYNRYCQPDTDNVLLLSDSFMLLDIGKPCKIDRKKIWIKVLSCQGYFGWFRVVEGWVEELTNE